MWHGSEPLNLLFMARDQQERVSFASEGLRQRPSYSVTGTGNGHEWFCHGGLHH
jgi:hypothetical protein